MKTARAPVRAPTISIEIGPLMSDVLTFGCLDAEGEVILVTVDGDAPLAGRLF